MKQIHTKFCEIPSSGNRVAPCGRRDRQTDMTKTMAVFRKVTKVPNKKGNIFDARNDCNRSKQAQENVTH